MTNKKTISTGSPTLTALSVAITSSLLLTAHPLMAQETNQADVESEQDKSAIEVIQVTSQKRLQNQQQVPIAISAFNENSIKRLGANSLSELQVAAPSFNFGANDRPSRGEISIRGVSDYSRNVGSSARASVYVDGVYMGRSMAADQSMNDIERVEVLRGPQGTLFGKDTVSGAVSIITKSPSDFFEVDVLAETGNYLDHKFAARVNMPVADKHAFSISVTDIEKQGYIYNSTLEKDTNNLSRSALRAKWKADISSSFNLVFGFDYLDDESDWAIGENIAPGEEDTPYEIASNVDTFDNKEIQGGSITANYDFDNGFSLTSITGYRDAEFNGLNDEDYSSDNVLTVGFVDGSNQISQELRLLSPKHDKYDYVLGLYYLDQNNSSIRTGTFGTDIAGGAINGVEIINSSRSGYRSLAAYLHGNYYWSDKWAFNAGVRINDEKVSIDFKQQNPIAFAFPTIGDGLDEQREVSDVNVSPKIGVNYFMNDNIMLYSSLSRAYRSAGFNADFIPNVDKFQFDREQATSFELGTKIDALDRTMRLNLAAFYGEFEDYQVFQFTPNDDGTTTLGTSNAAVAISQGIEAELNYKPVEDLLLIFNAAWIDAEFDTFKNGGGINVDFDGNDLPFSPQFNYYLAVNYDIYTDMGDWRLTVDHSYEDERYSHADNSDSSYIESHHVTNARATLLMHEGEWEVSAWIKNIADNDAVTHRNTTFLGVNTGVYELPRRYGVSVRYRFE